MKRCSFTWDRRFKKKQRTEEIWDGSEKYCIFHDPSKGKDTRLFDQKLEEKLNKKDYTFIEYFFSEDVNFNNWKFMKYADFNGATFQNADFSGATFQNADFSGVVIKENLEFNPESVEILDLRQIQFLSNGRITTDLTKTEFHFANLQNVAFIDCYWPRKIYEEIHMNDVTSNLSFKELETIYRNLKQNMYRHGDYDMAGKFYYREMELKIRKSVYG